MKPICPLENLRVESAKPLITPNELKKALPLTENTCATVANGREEIRAVLERGQNAFLVIIGLMIGRWRDTFSAWPENREWNMPERSTM